MCGDDKTVEGICKLENPARTGIWNTDGTFNEKRFEELKAHAVSEDGIEMVTLSIFQNFLSDLHGCGYSGMATTSYLIPVTWYQLTNGSIADFCDKFSDCTYDGNKAISIAKLNQFYNQPEVAGKEVEAKYSKTEI